MPYLIDGHNVIAALPDINLEDDNDEAQLVLKLRTWTSRIRRKAIVVFDGGITGGPSSDLSSPDVYVIFAARFHTNADRIIRERLVHLGDTQNWTVISSDREVLDQARLAGARVMTANQFADMLNQPLPEPEKPQDISPAAVNAWLEIFPEPESESIRETPERQQIILSQPSSQSRPKQNRKTKKPSAPFYTHNTPTVGEQLGYQVKSVNDADITLSSSEKPSEISTEEVEAWLEVFQEPEESSIARPGSVKKSKKVRKKAKPIVRKTGELTQDEVSVWLDIFPEPESQSIEDESRKDKNQPSEKRTYRKRKLNKKLAQHKSRIVENNSETSPSLTEEDQALWHRMFGSEE